MKWVRDYLYGKDGLGSWIKPAIGLEGQEFDYEYYSYDTGVAPYSDRTCDDGVTPEYAPQDTCWSLDNDAHGVMSVVGQAEKLAAFLHDLVQRVTSTGDDLKIDIVAHSQGAGLAIYTALDKLSQAEQRKLHSIITLDGVVGGVHAWDGLIILSLWHGKITRNFFRSPPFARHDR